MEAGYDTWHQEILPGQRAIDEADESGRYDGEPRKDEDDGQAIRAGSQLCRLAHPSQTYSWTSCG